MNKKLIFCSLFIFSIFFFFSAEVNASSPISAWDFSFYGDYCRQEKWRWLCQMSQTELAALREEDRWELVLDDFSSFGADQGIEFFFSPLEENFRSPVLTVSLRVIGETFGLARLEVYRGNNWQMVWGGVGHDRLVFNGNEPWREKIRLEEVLGDRWQEELKNGLWVRLQVGPLVSPNYVLPAIDQLAIVDDFGEEILTPTMGITVTLSPTATATLSLLTSTPNLDPTAILTPRLTAALTPSPAVTTTPTITPMPPTPTEVLKKKETVWLYPKEGETVSGKVVLEAILSEEGKEVGTSRQFFSWRPLGQSSWYQLPENVWQTESLPLGEYQLQARLTSEGGEEKSAEINVNLGVRIFNVFLTGRTLSWQTDRPAWGRIVYDRVSHSMINKDYPNFGYLWASEATSKQKQTSHQFTFGQIPTGRYYYRILAFGSPVSYSDEYILETDSLLIGEKEEVLGQKTSAETSFSSSVEPEEEKKEETLDQGQSLPTKNPFSLPRLLALFLAGAFLGGTIIHLTKKKK
ncbi:hypothetical protein KBI33_00780 [Candidatus Shapirobacteria bacterium]|nr:hypothetical protein [Candidatus Shapirobacteria bacterium]